MDIGGLVLEAVTKLVLTALSRGALKGIEGVLQRRKIEIAVEAAVLKVVEPLSRFLEMEKISDPQRQILIHSAELALTPLVEEPSRLFAGSLDGTRIAEQILAAGLPRDIRDEQLEGLYALLLPRLATVLCMSLPVIEEWRLEAWREGFRRLDDIAEQLSHVLARLDAGEQRAEVEADVLLARVRRSILQRVTLQMDLTALRSDRVSQCDFEQMFIRPSIVETTTRPENRRSASSEHEVARMLLAPSTRALVIGAPGSGKSTWLRWLERIGNVTHWPGIAVRVELRSLVRQAELPAWMALLEGAAGTHLARELDKPTMTQWRDQGRLAFLIDGFDEVPSDRRDDVQAWLVDLAMAAQGCPILLTSRPLTTEHLDTLAETWSRWTVEDFDDERITAYIARWYAHADLPVGMKSDVDAEALAEQWSADPTIRPLTGNPLLLATLLLVHVLDGSLPAGRAKLYQRYVEGMLGVWDNRHKRSVSIQLTQQHKHEILRDIAVRMFLGNIDQIEEKEITQIIAGTLQRLGQTAEPAQVLEFLRERTGLLIGPGNYTFSHKSVAEFLVAETIVEGSLVDDDGARIDRMRLFRHRYDDRWNTVLFLWAGLARKAELEHFIRDTSRDNTQDCWSLVFGLLADQSPRVDVELWTYCISAFEHFDVAKGSFGYSLFAFGPQADPCIEAPDFFARGLRSLHVGGILYNAWRSGVLDKWCPREQVTNVSLHWLLAITNIHSERWEEAAFSPPPGWGTDWTRVAIGWAIGELWTLAPDIRARRIQRIQDIVAPWREHLLARLINERAHLVDLDVVLEVAANADVTTISDRYCMHFPGVLEFNSRIICERLSEAVAQGLFPEDDIYRRAIANLEALDERVSRLTQPSRRQPRSIVPGV
jgi:hypothetical protein